MMDQKDFLGLAGKIALITGGGAGIGRSIAETYGAAGMAVAVLEIAPANAEAITTALAAAGVDHLVQVGDARRKADVDAMIAAVQARFGRLDVLVNNVGDHLNSFGAFADSTEEQWDGLYNANLRHMFMVTRAAIPLLRAGAPEASIINISTIEAFRGIPTLAHYGAFNAAITGFTMSLAVELGVEGIRVNAIAPESTNTAQIRGTRFVPPENLDDLRRWFPIGRFGEPEDCAGAALFLASNRLSGWVSGTTIHVDGGALAAGAWLRMRDGAFTHLPIIDRDGYVPPPKPAPGS
jgi:NAD(P)-dependent dehydrogenase (short-subunit alcohol dehydrogenase family)